MTALRISLGLMVAASCVFGQAVVSEIRLHADPSARIRPYESAAVQVRVYGRAGSAEGRLRRDGAEVRIKQENGGWLSKPYRFQGRDDEGFIDEYQTTAGKIFGQISGQYVMQDAVVYTAPEKAGAYTIEATLGDKTAELTIDVDPRAPSHKQPEQHAFGPEPYSLDPYRDLAEYWAPLIAQETWWQPKTDYITRFDYDGDWKGDNNWDNLSAGTSQAYVYYAAMETETHYFLVYNVFHPRDYTDKCVAGSCHENDNEGLILTVLKDGSADGRLQTMETLAHNNIYSFSADNRVRNGVHNIDGAIDFYQHRPVVFIESGGHGIYGAGSSHARYDVKRDQFTPGPGVTYIYKGTAERPRHPGDRLVGYELLPIYNYWWLRASRDSAASSGVFDDFFTYTPRGQRPGASFRSIGGAFLGRKYGRNMAKPFWGWHDNRTRKQRVLAVGQWGLDPAYSVSRNLRFPGPFSTAYVFNPYLRPTSGYEMSQAAPPPRIGATTNPDLAERAPMPAEPAPAAPATPAPVPDTPEAAPAAPGSSGLFEVFLWADDAVEITIRGDRATFRTLRGAPHRAFEGIPNQPLPRGPLRDIQVHVRQGRGTVRITERPSARNGYALKLRVDDPKPGGETYHIFVEWRR